MKRPKVGKQLTLGVGACTNPHASQAVLNHGFRGSGHVDTWLSVPMVIRNGSWIGLEHNIYTWYYLVSLCDLFGMVSSRDPNSKGMLSDLQRLGIKFGHGG